MEGIYLYGIVNLPPSLSLDLIGLGEKAVYLIPYLDLAAVVSDSPLRPYPIEMENAAVHETVVEAVMLSQTILPMRFNTILGSRERVLSMLAEHYEAFQADLLRLKGKVEMGLKVIWENRPDINGSRFTVHGSRFEGHGPGQRFLLTKWAEHVITEAIRDEGEGLIKRIQASLVPLSTENALHPFPTKKLLLDAAYLVEERNQKAFHAGVEKLVGEMPDLHFLLTGPWPPYSFVRISKG